MMETWTDDLPVCKMTGVGFQANQKYKEGGGRYEVHAFEDSYFHFQLQEENCSLYGLFDGHDSNKVSNFARQRLPAELLLGQLQGAMTEADVKRLLKQSFESVERGFFEFIDELLVQRTNLQLQIPEGMSILEASQRFPRLVERLQELDKEIAGGAAAVIVLILYDKLYVANVGNTRALLCTKDENGILHIEQISTDHNTKSQVELQHLANVGLDIEQIQIAGKLGKHDITRSLGDYHVKGGYRDVDLLRLATREPVTAEPSIYGGRSIDESFYFLALMSDGVYRTLEQATNGAEITRDIASMIAAELKEQTTIEGVAQAVVDKICRIHQDEFVRSNGKICQQREDMTLVLRLFGAKLGGKIQTPVTIGNLIQSVSCPQTDISSFPVTIPYKESIDSLFEDTKLPPLTMPGLGSSSSLPPSRVTTPVSAGGTSTPPVYSVASKPRYENPLCKSFLQKNLGPVPSSSNPPLPKAPNKSPGMDGSPDSCSTPENPSCSSGSTPTGFSSPTSDEHEYPSTTRKPEDEDVDQEKKRADFVLRLEASKKERGTGSGKGTPKHMMSQDHRGSISDKAGTVISAPRSLELGQDDRVDPYVDFAEFFENVALQGGEAVVFAEFM